MTVFVFFALTFLLPRFAYYKAKNVSEFIRPLQISDPKDIIQNKSKASGCFQYICCDSWENYSSQLFDVLAKALNLKLQELKSTIIEKSNNSPRTLKNIFQKIVIYNDSSIESVNKAIKLTLEEIV